MPVAAFIRGAFSTLLEKDEWVAAVRIPKLSRTARWGWYKACRKPGEFASAIGAVVIDPERNIRRAVMGATGGRPTVPCGDAALPDAADRALAGESGRPDRFERQVQRVALRRAFAAALS